MKLLLTQNLPYTRAHGGANRSNRFLAEALAARGHQVRAVTPALASPSAITVEELLDGLSGDGVAVERGGDAASFELSGVAVRAVYEAPRLRAYVADQVARWAPDWVLVSSEDPTQSLLEAALQAAPSRVVYLAHTPQMMPFGPYSMYPGEARTARIGQARAVVTISRFVADYIATHTGFETFTNHPPHYGAGPFPHLGRWDNPYVLLMNASTIKGLPIFLDLARALPGVAFATVPGYATRDEDRAALAALPNVTLLANREKLDDLLAEARVVLLPSLWTEGFGMATVDAMLRGVPVLAADHGGLREAALGAAELLPVEPIRGFEDRLGDNLLPLPVVPPQDAGPWRRALEFLLADRTEYEARSAAARRAAGDFVAGLGVEPFEAFLAELARQPERRAGARRDAAAAPSADADPGADADPLAGLSADQRALLVMNLVAAAADAAGGDAASLAPIPTAPRQADGELPLSFAQQRLWFAAQLEPGSAAYNMSSAIRLGERVAAPALAQTLAEVVRRHEVLRTTFPARDGKPFQRVAARWTPPLPVVDLAGLDGGDRGTELLRLAREEAARPFDLAAGPLLRAFLIRSGEAAGEATEGGDAVLFDLHHIVSDGWSVAVLEHELAVLYGAYRDGAPSPLAELPVQYADYAVWQRRRLDGDALEAELAWWKAYLGEPGEPSHSGEPLPLPFDRPRPQTLPPGGAGHGFEIGGDAFRRLHELARRHGASLYMVLLAVFAALLHRWTGRDRVVVGSPVAGRLRREVEGLVGFFVNTLALAPDLSGDPTFDELVARVRDGVLGAFSHQEVPYERVVEAVRPRRGGGAADGAGGLFRVMFAFQGGAGGGGGDAGGGDGAGGDLERLGLRPQGLRRGVGRTLFDLMLSASAETDRVVANFSYSPALFDAATVEAMAQQLAALAASAAEDPARPVSALPLPAETPAQRRLAGWAAEGAGQAARQAAQPAAGDAGDEEDRRRAEQRQAELTAKRSRLSGAKRELLRQRLRQRAAGEAEHGIPRRGDDGPARLSFSQQRLWFLWQLEPDSPLYNIPAAVRLSGPLSVPALTRAMDAIVRRHEVLRTHFEDGPGGRPVQIVDPPADLAVPLIDLSALPAAQREAEVQRLADAEAARPFDLTRSPQLRATLVHTAPQEHVALVVMHHIASDGWSASIFVRELKALYAAYASGRDAALAELPVQYADFAEWQRSHLDGKLLEKQLAYWREVLGGDLPVLEMPTDRPRPPLQTYPGSTQSLALPAGTAEAVERFSRAAGHTPFVTLLAAFDVLLSRYSGQTDLLVGNPTANRQHPDVEDLIGFFVNTLVMRSDVSGDPTFEDLAARVRETVVGAQSHQDLPFEKLVEELQPPRDPSRSPLFQVMLVQQTAPRQAPAAETGLTLKPMRAEGGTAQFDLILILSQAGDDATCHFRYNTDLFDATTVRRMLHHYARLLGTAVAEPRRPLSALPMLSAAELLQVTAEWNDTAAAYERQASIAEVFAARVDETPDAVALVADGSTLTYRELDAAANRLAHHLTAFGVAPGVATGVCLRRSPDLVVALLAILKAGGAYVPLDPDYPMERLSMMLEDAGISVLVTVDELADALPTMWALVVSLDGDAEMIAAAEASRPRVEVPADSLAYVMYTSGSTGRPKGVAVTQRNVVRLVRGSNYFRVAADDVFLLLAPISFDASTFELWGALLNGARVAVAPAEAASLEELGETVRRLGVTTLWLTAGLFHQMVDERLDDLRPLRQLLAGGDVLSPRHVDRVLEELPDTVLINGYGPTETTTFAACHRMSGERRGGGPVSIGRPVGHGAVLLLDGRGEPTPVAVYGELMIGGDGVARGYHGRPALTAERFVPDPLAGRRGRPAGGRLYRTGDLARWQADGRLDFAGRRDSQVKVRGFRIELGEVEAVLGRHPVVERAVAAAPPDGHGNRRLVAYYVARDGASPADGELASFLRERLPEFMVPSLFVPLDALPLGATGKVDRGALPSPEELLAGLTDDYTAPRTVVEEVMAEIWAQVLGLPRVGIHDDFFAIGGHSLLGTLLVTRMRESLGVEVNLRHLFETPTIAELAPVADAAMRRDEPLMAPPMEPVSRQQALPLSFAQQRLWFLHRLDPGSPMYNVPAPVRLSGELAVSALEAALEEIVRRHEVLRTHFEEERGEAVQVITEAAFRPLPLIDLTALAEADREPEAERLAAEDGRRPFDLAQGPLVRRALVRLAPQEHSILLTMHHIVSDGWSIGILLREVRALHDAFRAGAPSPLDELAVQYADFAHWQRGWLTGAALEAQLDYWRDRLGGDLPVLELPFDRPAGGAGRGVAGSSRSLLLPAEAAEALRGLSRDTGSTLFMTLLAVFKALLFRYSGRPDVVVGSPIANRNRAEIEPLVGFFVNTLALRTRFAADVTFRDLLAKVRDTALGAYVHQDLPFEKIVEELHPDRDMQRNPVFQVAFALQNATRESLQLTGLRLKTAGGGTGVVHFDLILSMSETAEGGLKASLAYDLARFDDDSAGRMLGHLVHLVEQIAADPDRPLHEYQVMDDSETGGYSPGDFPEAELSQKELEDLFLELSQPEVGS